MGGREKVKWDRKSSAAATAAAETALFSSPPPLLYFSPLPRACSWSVGRSAGNMEEEEEEEEEGREGINIALRSCSGRYGTAAHGVWVSQRISAHLSLAVSGFKARPGLSCLGVAKTVLEATF